jgi:flagellar basal body-associated protein FliL
MGTFLVLLLLVAAAVGGYMWWKSRQTPDEEVEKTDFEKTEDLQKMGPRCMGLGLGSAFDLSIGS